MSTSINVLPSWYVRGLFLLVCEITILQNTVLSTHENECCFYGCHYLQNQQNCFLTMCGAFWVLRIWCWWLSTVSITSGGRPRCMWRSDSRVDDGWCQSLLSHEPAGGADTVEYTHSLYMSALSMLNENISSPVSNHLLAKHGRLNCCSWQSLPSAFSAAFPSCNWSSTALNLLPHNKSTPRVVTRCCTQTQLPPASPSWTPW